MAKKGKRFRAAAEIVKNAGGALALQEAVSVLKKTASAKFDESVDVDIRLGVDPRHADQMVRGVVALPHGTGRSVRVLVFTNEGRFDEATAAGADHVGRDELMDKVQKGWFEFDVIIATPDVMAKVGRLGRVLGPRGLMPNPKSGTVTPDIAKAVSDVKAGKIDFRVDKNGNLHASVGKASFNQEQIFENASAFIKEVLRLRPSSAKGTYLRSVTLSTTMGPGIPVDRNEVANSLR